MTTISPDEATRILPAWRYVSGSLEVALTATDFARAFEFLGRIADLAETQQHHPDIDVRYNRVRLRVTSHDSDGLTDRDVDFARAAGGTLVTEDHAPSWWVLADPEGNEACVHTW